MAQTRIDRLHLINNAITTERWTDAKLLTVTAIKMEAQENTADKLEALAAELRTDHRSDDYIRTQLRQLADEWEPF